MFAISVLYFVAVVCSTVLGERIRDAVPEHIPLANFTQILEEAKDYLSLPGQHSNGLEPCTLKPGHLKFAGEVILFLKFRVFGITRIDISNVHQKTDQDSSVYFTMMIPRVDSIGTIQFQTTAGEERVIANSKDEDIVFKVRVTVRLAKKLIRMRVVRVSRSYAMVSRAKSWFSAPVENINRKIVSSAILKVIDPCIENLLRRYAHIVNDLLSGHFIVYDNRLAKKVAKIADKRLNPLVPIEPFQILKQIKCFERKHKIVFKQAEIDSLKNCSISRPSVVHHTLHVVYKCAHIRFRANTTVEDTNTGDIESFESEITISIQVYGNIFLDEEHAWRRRIIHGMSTRDLLIFKYDTEMIRGGKGVSKQTMVGECLKRFIFVDGKRLMKNVVRFD